MWTAQVLTLFPNMFPGPLGESITGKALAEQLWALETLDIRNFATDRHQTVDGAPAGGGAGMVMRADVLAAAIDAARADIDAKSPLIYLSPRGRRFDEPRAKDIASGPGVTLICGRYEGVDQRVLDARDVEEVSVGDYILSGGELAAYAIIDAVVRLLPGVIGNAEGLAQESFEDGLLEYPQFTRPQVWEGRKIPEVLTSGHHANIAAWRRRQSEDLTRDRRPDMWKRYQERVNSTKA